MQVNQSERNSNLPQWVTPATGTRPGHPNLIRNWEVGGGMMAAGGLRKKSSKVNAFKTKLQISHCCSVHFNKYYENTLSLWFQLSLPSLLHPKPTACYWQCKASKTPLTTPTGPMNLNSKNHLNLLFLIHGYKFPFLTKLFLFTPISFSTLLN